MYMINYPWGETRSIVGVGEGTGDAGPKWKLTWIVGKKIVKLPNKMGNTSLVLVGEHPKRGDKKEAGWYDRYRFCFFRGLILKYQLQFISTYFNLFQSTFTILTKFNLSYKKHSTHFKLLQPTSSYFNLPQPISPFYPPQFTYEKNKPIV